MDASRFAPGDFGYVLRIDALCVAAGMPSMSPWWQWGIGDFYASGAQWGIFDVGRGGGKSTTLERVAAAMARYGERRVPPGQVWTWPFISVGPDDANRRISGIAAVLKADGLAIIGEEDASGEKAKSGVKITRAPRGSLELEDIRGNAIQLASVAGTIGNVSGPSTIGATVDEAAKLLDRATGANPLTEIIASLAQTSRARAGWRAIVCSSSWGREGMHYELVERGSNESAYVATIGERFLEGARQGFLDVAAWEEARGDTGAAEMIRTHAATLKPGTPYVPTWTANPTLGHPQGLPWDGAALASRRLVEVLPERALDGLPRAAFWLRENGSVPLDRGGSYGAQCIQIAERLREINGQRRPRVGSSGLLTFPGLPSWDPRSDRYEPTRGGSRMTRRVL